MKTAYIPLLLLLSLILIGCSSDLEKGSQAYTEERWQEAIDYYSTILSDHESYQHAKIGIGLAYYKLGKLEQAIVHLKPMVDHKQARGMTPSNWTGLAVSIFLPRKLLMKRKASIPRRR